MKEIENALQCPEICQRLREISYLNEHCAPLPMFPGYSACGDSSLQRGVAGWSSSKPREPWLCTAEVFDASIEMLCRSNSESATLFVFLPAQTRSSLGCAVKNMKLLS